ncbi:MAG: SUMF1/EgtB/PvdO family nonheme iron enzyme, partial [Nitrospirales bacterium]
MFNIRLSQRVSVWLIVMLIFMATSSTYASDRGILVSPSSGEEIGSVWGVFVGVSTYQNTGLTLEYADDDARAFHDFYDKHFQGRVPADQFQVLVNEQVSRSNFLQTVGEVLRRAQPEDLVVLFLAMHGLLDASGQDLYFLTHEADPNLPEAQGISRHDLLRQIDRSKARKIILLLDACHTGAFASSQTMLARRSAGATDINRLLGAMGQAQDGVAVMSSSTAAEFSQEGQQFCGGHGAFTCALLTGLEGKADTNHNGLVELRELFDHTYRMVKASTKSHQHPSIEGRYDNRLPLAEATGAVSEPKSLPVEKIQESLTQETTQDSPKSNEPLQEVRARPLQIPVPLAPSSSRQAAPESMVLIQKGEFWMGSAPEEVCEWDSIFKVEFCLPVRNADYAPRHRVALPAFYLDRYEVTNKEFHEFVKAKGYDTTVGRKGSASALMKTTGFFSGVTWEIDAVEQATWEQPEGGRSPSSTELPSHPVVQVSWFDADAYCQWASKRLPTEAEWEYAARAGTETDHWWGSDAPNMRRVGNVSDVYAKTAYGLEPIFVNYDDGYERTAPVGSYDANLWGIHDMTGNVWEWTADWYDRHYYHENISQNPPGPSSGTDKVKRGGSWHTYQFV